MASCYLRPVSWRTSFQVCRKLSHFTSLRSCVIVGGESIEQQFETLSKNPDIVFATPGRLMHLLLEVPDFNLKSVQFISCVRFHNILHAGVLR